VRYGHSADSGSSIRDHLDLPENRELRVRYTVSTIYVSDLHQERRRQEMRSSIPIYQKGARRSTRSSSMRWWSRFVLVVPIIGLWSCDAKKPTPHILDIIPYAAHDLVQIKNGQIVVRVGAPHGLTISEATFYLELLSAGGDVDRFVLGSVQSSNMSGSEGRSHDAFTHHFGHDESKYQAIYSVAIGDVFSSGNGETRFAVNKAMVDVSARNVGDRQLTLAKGIVLNLEHVHESNSFDARFRWPLAELAQMSSGEADINDFILCECQFSERISVSSRQFAARQIDGFRVWLELE